MIKADKYLKETISEILENGQWDKITRIGEIKIMNCGEVCEIIDYCNSEDITVRFKGSDNLLINKTYHNFKKGSIKNPYSKKIYNEGYVGYGKYSWNNNINEYRKWHGILDRCYNKSYQEKYPTYKGCSVDEIWKCFQVFAKWFKNTWKPHMEGWHLDKDILFKGNKIYSPETCCFVPQEINLLFVKNNNGRGKYPIGVRKTKACNFTARLNKKHLGTFDTEEEAFQAYKIAKEEYIKEVADRWKDQIEPRVYQALYNYQVEITD